MKRENALESFDKNRWIDWQKKFIDDIKIEESWDFIKLDKKIKDEFPRSDIVYIAGMKRSGNHAISNWIINNCFESMVYINNATNKIPDIIQVYYAHHVSPTMIDRVICTFENVDVESFNNLNPFYIARDPYNWLASWTSHGHCNLEDIDKDIKSYLDNLNISKNIINFNSWFSNREYRDLVSNSIRFINYDHGINEVTGFGRGSSFDKREYNGMAQKMDILNRWKNMKNNYHYVEIVRKYKNQFDLISKKFFTNIDSNKIYSYLEI